MVVGFSRVIAKLEKDLGFALPLAYRKHIQRHGSKSPIIGTDCAPKDVLSNTEYLPDLLRENEIEYGLPKNLVCFLMHQGYMAAWFDAEDGEDPECMFFSEGTTPQPQPEGRFSTFIEKMIKDWGSR